MHIEPSALHMEPRRTVPRERSLREALVSKTVNIDLSESDEVIKDLVIPTTPPQTPLPSFPSSFLPKYTPAAGATQACTFAKKGRGRREGVV